MKELEAKEQFLEAGDVPWASPPTEGGGGMLLYYFESTGTRVYRGRLWEPGPAKECASSKGIGRWEENKGMGVGDKRQVFENSWDVQEAQVSALKTHQA